MEINKLNVGFFVCFGFFGAFSSSDVFVYIRENLKATARVISFFNR